ncbi:MAG TPA: alpha/beta hydrolase-fold protein, partial [Saprospiraceae bacterium]|nr:alpha/beta hydrolase-fold protein [Saprospiraceae bacterium]
MTDLRPIIEIIDENFMIPQLNRTRRISALLPYDYYSTDKKYSVLYLHDGQNLFDDYAPYGNWGVDKTLAKMAAQGQSDTIIIAIDHGGELRIKELIPFKTRKFGEVEGEQYLDFMMHTLRPMINEKYRIHQDRNCTGIGGSSLGGLISLYAGFKYPHIFGKMMIFSPSLWVTNDIYIEALNFPNDIATDIYLYAGGLESET